MTLPARPRRAGRPPLAAASGTPTPGRRGAGARRRGPKRQRSAHGGETRHHRQPTGAQETGAPTPHTGDGGTPTTDERRRHRPPIESLPPPREQAADPRKAARRRAPPLAAGTPEDSIARAGGRASQGPDPRKGPQGGAARATTF